MKKILCLFIALTIMLGSAAALADTITIGGLAPLTGPVSVYGIAVQRAVDLYVKEINEAGGINGNLIEMEWLDDKHNTTEVVNAYYRLSDMDGIAGIIGPVTSGPTLAILESMVEDGIPMVTASATNDDITANITGNIFRTCYKDTFQGKTMAVFAANSQQYKKVAILYDNTSDYSVGIAEMFRETAAELGLEIVADEAAISGAGDFKAQLTKIAATDMEALLVPMYYEDSALIIRQAHEVGITVPILGIDGWDGIQDVIEDISLMDGYFFCNHSAVDDDNPAIVAFQQKYTEEYGEIPNTFANLGYDAAAIMISAIERAGSTDWAAINAALAATDLDGITGHIQFDEYGDVLNKPGVIISIQDGQFTFYERINP